MIYFIQCGGERGPVKIGYTNRPVRDRLVNMQCDNPHPLSIIGVRIGTRADEAELHVRFASLHISGEWFRPGEELLSVASACPFIPPRALFDKEKFTVEWEAMTAETKFKMLQIALNVERLFASRD